MDVRPFRAWRYHTPRSGPLPSLTAPLAEFAAASHMLYRAYAHSIHLAAPRSTAQAADRWHRWRQQGMVRHDPLPALYAYSQTFIRDHTSLTRTGLIALVRLNDPAEARADIQYHEAVRPANVQAISSLLARMRSQPSPAFGLYHDAAFQVEPYLEQALALPLADFGSDDGVHHRLAPIQHMPTVQAIRAALAPQSVIVADGHHRTAAAEAYRDQLAATGRPLPPDALARYGFLYLSNSAEVPGQPNPNAIQPLHRVVQLAPDADIDALLQRLEVFFHLQPLDKKTQLAQALPTQAHHYVLLARGIQRRLTLKPDVAAQLPPLDLHPAVLALDTTLLHWYALDQALGLAFAQHASDPRIHYHKSLPAAAEAASHLGAVGFLLRGVPLADFRAATAAGALMPAKTTYFEPKVLSGLLFASLDDDHHRTPFDSGLWLPPAPPVAG